MKLLSREMFREEVLGRNNGFCCVPGCSLPAVDAHHIFNRNLFVEESEKGGYFYNNGAQLCSNHHYQAEITKITPEELWEWCQVAPCFPLSLNTEKKYDCWGNEVLPDGFRKAGSLFRNEGFQKIIKKHHLKWLFL